MQAFTNIHQNACKMVLNFKESMCLSYNYPEQSQCNLKCIIMYICRICKHGIQFCKVSAGQIFKFEPAVFLLFSQHQTLLGQVLQQYTLPFPVTRREGCTIQNAQIYTQGQKLLVKEDSNIILQQNFSPYSYGALFQLLALFTKGGDKGTFLTYKQTD